MEIKLSKVGLMFTSLKCIKGTKNVIQNCQN